ncbi:DUF4352 domain-containing protein [Couchioplanes azureus]|uniref:DUF4352 domain-containing protein n=1 Tax=Couchioplanes caeruleus TaxID=56438 RepID=UPI00166F7424|nr:DUF4352 domain-containing protein [Couchioplanes caeruleus]
MGVFMVMCFGGCTALVSSAAESSKTKAPSVSDPGESASDRDAPAKDDTGEKPEGPVVAKVGQTITVRPWRIGEDGEVKYTLSNVKKAKSPNGFMNPKNGTYVTAKLEIKVIKGSEFASTSDLSFVTSDGTVYEPTWSGGFDGEFDAVELKAGQRKSGLVVFDVPKSALKGGQVHVSSLWDDESYGYWKL